MSTSIEPPPPGKLARNTALAFFTFWLAVLLAGSDKPPPIRFLWVILTVALCAAAVYWRVPTYVAWSRTKRPGRLWRAGRDGLAAGLVVALPFALGGSGEPTASMGPADYAGWFAVMGAMGVLNSLGVYAICALAARAS